MIRTLACLAAVVSGCSGGGATPLSIEVHYSADAPALEQAAALADANIGVARFTDGRVRHADDLHASSYVAHDDTYLVGVTWRGRTFTPVADVVQALLVEELAHAGLKAQPIDAELAVGDVLAARNAAERAQVDVVLTGNIREFDFRERGRGGDRATVAFDVEVVEPGSGKVLMRGRLQDLRRGPAELAARQRAREVLGTSFKNVAHQLIAELAQRLLVLGETPEKPAAASAHP